MIRLRRIKRTHYARRRAGRQVKTRLAGICTLTTSRGHLHLILNVLSLSLTKWNSRFPDSRVADADFAQMRNALRAIKTSTIRESFRPLFALVTQNQRENESCKLQSEGRRKDMYSGKIFANKRGLFFKEKERNEKISS